MRQRRSSPAPILLALAWAAVAAAPALGADARAPVDVRIPILFKVLTYDSNLQARAAKGVRFGILSLAADREGRSVAEETLAEIQKNVGKKVSGLAITVSDLPLEAGQDLKALLTDRQINTLYLCPGLGKRLPLILALAKEQKILVLTGEAEQVKAGAAVGVVLRDLKPKILINLVAAQEQGAALDARLLRLAELVQ